MTADDSLVSRTSKYQVRVFEGDKLIKVFGTDIEEYETVILQEAQRHAEYVQRENPGKIYHVLRKIRDDARLF